MIDTIFALATAQGRAGVAVVRISGPSARQVGVELCGPLPDHGRRLCRLTDGAGDLVDEALVLTFQGPHSFTGEDVVELHLHGSIAIVQRVLDLIGQSGQARHATAGEFSRRALENGRLDLTQIEGLADLIDAETEAQRRQAMRIFAGDLGELVKGWREQLLRAAALIEASIDFADEDVPQDVTREVRTILEAVMTELDHQSNGVAVAERIRSGFEIAIVGAPNVGKSTLLNYLAGRDAAITSDIPGTTRDLIEIRTEIAGFAVTFVDTAGLRVAQDEIERIGIERGVERSDLADFSLKLFVEEVPLEIGGSKDIIVQTKSDLHSRWADIAISVVTGDGLDALTDAISERLKEMSGQAGLAMRARHRDAMLRAKDRLSEALGGIDAGYGSEMVAADVRLAVVDLGEMIGHIGVEDLLGEIFSSFCIGK